MAARTSSEAATVRVRILSPVPPSRFEGRPTEFGLQDRDRALHPVKVHLDLCWDEVESAIGRRGVLEADATGPEWGVLKNWHGLNAGREWRLKAR